MDSNQISNEETVLRKRRKYKAYPYYYRFNGTTWTKLSGDSYGVEAMWGSSTSDVFGVGQTIRHFNGTAWTEMTSPTSQRLRTVWGSSPTNVFAVGQGGHCSV